MVSRPFAVACGSAHRASAARPAAARGAARQTVLGFVQGPEVPDVLPVGVRDEEVRALLVDHSPVVPAVVRRPEPRVGFGPEDVRPAGASGDTTPAAMPVMTSMVAVSTVTSAWWLLVTLVLMVVLLVMVVLVEPCSVVFVRCAGVAGPSDDGPGWSPGTSHRRMTAGSMTCSWSASLAWASSSVAKSPTTRPKVSEAT